MSLLRLIKATIIFVGDIQVKHIVIQNIVYELTLTLGINSFLIFVDDRSRWFLLLY